MNGINSLVHFVAESALRLVDPMQKRAEWLGRRDGKRNAHVRDPGLTESEQSIIVYYRLASTSSKAGTWSCCSG